MYKVFINDKPLFFINEINGQKGLVIHFESNDSISEIIQQLETNDSCNEAYLYHPDPETSKKAFFKMHHYIEAAGGVIKNSKGEILFIFRLGKWDLPKGKIEQGESTTEAALREVEEECGINQLSILLELPSTYHTYPWKGKKVLKRTYWYEMFCKDPDKIKAQEEENITGIEWKTAADIPAILDNTYASIRDVISDFKL